MGRGPWLGLDVLFQGQQRQRDAPILEDFHPPNAVDLLDPDAFQPRNRLHGDAELLVGMIREQQRCLGLVADIDGRFVVLGQSVFLGQGEFAVRGDAGYVQDQSHLPIAEDRGSGQGVALLHMAAQRLDHDLFRVVQAVDDEAVLQVSRLHDDDVDRGSLLRFAGLVQAECGVEPHQWQQLAA